jgi:hypothetical protein
MSLSSIRTLKLHVPFQQEARIASLHDQLRKAMFSEADWQRVLLINTVSDAEIQAQCPVLYTARQTLRKIYTEAGVRLPTSAS